MTAPQECRDKFRGEELAVGLHERAYIVSVMFLETRTSIVAWPSFKSEFSRKEFAQKGLYYQDLILRIPL
jgi:hypothetical protein